MSDQVKGRLDVFFSRLVEEGCKRAQAKTGFDFWNGLPEHGQSGMKQIVEDLIDQCGIPRVAIDLPRTLARAGLAELSGIGSNVPKSSRVSGTGRREGGHHRNKRRARGV